MKYICSTLFLLLLLCISPGSTVNAQYEWEGAGISLKRNTVIATGGLNLRSTPSTHGKIVARLPYSTEVEILETRLFNLDSINRFYEWLQPYGWAKIRVGRNTGYVYDSYLYYSTPSVDSPKIYEWPEGINTKYRLITNLGTAVGSYDPFAFKWYGLYPQPNACSLQRVKPTFRYFAGEIEESLHIVADTDAQPTFFIGGPKAWATGIRQAQTSVTNGTAEDHRRTSEAACAANGISVKAAETGSWASANEFTLKVGDLQQHLTLSGRTRTALYLEVAADFDGDGKPDFIISYDTADLDMTITYVLFLSSEARPGELVRPVAMEYSYNGC